MKCLANYTAICGLLLTLSSSAAEAGLVSTLGDITNWTGSGSQQAAMVVDWNDGRAPLAFGYRFDGAPTGEDMLLAIAAADPGFYLRLSTAPFGTFGYGLYGIGYDRNGGGFGISDNIGDETNIFNANGLAFTGVPDSTDSAASSNDPADSYKEGWNTGFWSYWVGNGQPYNGGSWSSPPTGSAGQTVTDGAWHGFSFDPTFAFNDPPAQAISAVPEPSSLTLLSLAGCAACLRRRRRAPR